ncbi:MULTISPECIES: RAMP superfamily CRISPR-associated protein [Microbulbifer]|uniref:RAMP superfamily CRISPR-associated protein n=1 Tax=Microbulbifer TaxID=48073 RepID=UPI00074790E8|nr:MULTISPECIES: RAMP superfamily CRISPR-associated protein [Microbulbifer]KUJ83442.1 hypothetical protein AVO43_06145 [Microbulbifer sp. ZGT114]
MKPFFQQETLTLSTLSPVHLGCDEHYQPTEYVMEDGNLYALGQRALLAALSPEQLASACGADSLVALRSLLYRQRMQLMPHARHVVACSPALQRHYEQVVDKAAQVESRGRRVQNNLEIQRTAFNPHSQQPIIPGSGVKGAIRTALLDAINAGAALSPPAEKYREVRMPRSRELQQQLLDYERVESDPLRHLKVSDGVSECANDLPRCRVHYAVNRKRKPAKQESRANRGPENLLESLAAGLDNAFSLDWQLSSQGLPGADTLEQLAKVCNRFHLPLLRTELDNLAILGIADSGWLTGLRQLLSEELATALKHGRALLLRLGRYNGADSKTLNGVRHIKIMGGKGEKPTFQPAPKTYWLAADAKTQTTGLLPFGWVLLRRPGCQLPATDAFLKRLAAPLQQLAEQESVRKQQRDAALARQAEERAERAQREAEERAEAQARSAALAAMSEQQRSIHTLQERREAGEGRGQGPGCELANDLRGLMQQAIAGWSPADRQALASAAREIYRHLGIDVKKNKKAKAALKELAGD